MADPLENYFNELINQISVLAQISLDLEQRIFSIQDRKDLTHDHVVKEVNGLKATIDELNFFVQNLTDKFEYLSKTTSSFVTSDEFDALKTKIDRIEFEKLAVRKVWKSI